MGSEIYKLLVIFHIAPLGATDHNSATSSTKSPISTSKGLPLNIGTLLRCGDVTERRIAFFGEAGLDCIQIAGVYENWLAPSANARAATDALFGLFEEHGMSVPSLFLSYAGQDWDHPESTVGLFPQATRSERMVATCRQMEWAARRGVRVIACHAGFVPEERNGFYDRFVADMKSLIRFAAALGQDFLFETGSETAGALTRLLDDIDEPNTGINFDPANILIYGMGDPAEALAAFGDRIRGVHCKDANPPAPGTARGRETPLGKGSTDFGALLGRLLDSGFRGPLVIERELPPGPEQERDVAEAAKFLNSLLKGHKQCSK